jgi:CheY-like chemotaxis protein/CHASE3 domain sensor protein
MNDRQRRGAPQRRAGQDFSLALAAVVLVFVASGAVSFFNTRTLSRDAELVTHTQAVLSTLDELLSLVKDAETGQRGYLITGDANYLAPHTRAIAVIDQRLDDVQRLTSDNRNQQDRIPALRARIAAKLAELNETINLRRTKGFDAAQSVVRSDRGKVAMDDIREQVGEMVKEELRLRDIRLAEMDTAYRVAVGGGVLTGILGLLLSAVVAYLVRRAMVARQREEWLLTAQSGLSEVMVGDPKVERLGQNVLKFLTEYLDAHAGALFASEGGRFHRVAAYGVPAEAGVPEAFEFGDGLLGQAAKDRRSFFVRDVPEGYLRVGSALGQSSPRSLAIAPLIADDTVNAVIELGFLHPLNEATTELLARIAEPVGMAIRSAHYRGHLQNLLEETQRQAEELQAQSEDLRVSNEELEEQGRALKESQSRLEQQQAELEQTNAQLEEQAQLLEAQRDDMTRTASALESQARELEQASRYKSDFLANMSHELRTPLNSSLILAKLLADNPHGNLSDEQVKFAETIQSAGNDLLNLINDILDLSKIESGRMEMQPEPVHVSNLTAGLARTFEPIAREKGLTFQMRVEPGCPETLETDRQRLEQVLKNLLSNAMKFTERGEVELVVSREQPGRIAFAVKDTGIGIARDQHQSVFEAFRQADGTTNRKYGGTGLGLSISRELTRLLGGDIRLSSEPGRGSIFTVSVPEVFATSLTGPSAPAVNLALRSPALPPESGSSPSPAARRDRSRVPPAPAPGKVDDDRERLADNNRVILIVEDDEPFARVLYDLAHELEFQCLIATTAEEAMVVASQYLPSAVVLDVGLPDHSGLSVLDRLKHDARTRHIPVHVVSAGDYAETALSLGAVAFMLKPVKREQLVEALKSLESRLAQHMRRVLVVEDDPVQLDSLKRLLGSHEVEAVGVSTAAECLEKLREATFDCMVLDLSLPDASGYSLLETLSREEAYAFPAVIVYTGRDLSLDEEQRLRRYSKSIIIKGAKSPERLLDEVTLFLHQVVTELPPEQQRMLEKARSRDAILEGRRILVVEDDVRNVFALTSVLEPKGATVQISRNGREAIEALEKKSGDPAGTIDLILMDVMMPEMDGITATREIRRRAEWRKLPIIMLTAKAMKDDQERCLAAGASDYIAKPLDVEKLLSLVRVWMPR